MSKVMCCDSKMTENSLEEWGLGRIKNRLLPEQESPTSQAPRSSCPFPLQRTLIRTPLQLRWGRKMRRRHWELSFSVPIPSPWAKSISQRTSSSTGKEEAKTSADPQANLVLCLFGCVSCSYELCALFTGMCGSRKLA